MGIDVLPPDINTSGWDFTIEDRQEIAIGDPVWFGRGEKCRTGTSG